MRAAAAAGRDRAESALGGACAASRGGNRDDQRQWQGRLGAFAAAVAQTNERAYFGREAAWRAL